mgnify:CR=1 FL=1
MSLSSDDQALFDRLLGDEPAPRRRAHVTDGRRTELCSASEVTTRVKSPSRSWCSTRLIPYVVFSVTTTQYPRSPFPHSPRSPPL